MRLQMFIFVSTMLFGFGPFTAEAKTCDPFIPSKECTAPVDFSSGVHDSIALAPGGTAHLTVVKAPAFSTCQASYTPSALTRTVDASVATLLTTLSGLVFVGGNPALEAEPMTATAEAHAAITASRKRQGSLAGEDAEARNIEFQLNAIETEETRLAKLLDEDQTEYKLGVTGTKDSLGQVVPGLNTTWGSTDEATVQKFIDKVRDKLTDLVEKRPEPSIADLDAELDAVSRALGVYHQNHDAAGIAADWLAAVNDRLNLLAGVAARDQDHIADILTVRASFKQALSQFPKPAPLPYPKFTEQKIDAFRFFNSNVGISISCKDNATQAPYPTTITFTAYYTKLPWLDVSSGPLFSLLGRHQVGVIPQSMAQMATLTNPNGTFGVTDQSSFQVLPMAFVEMHQRGFRCPWAHASNAERPFGYVCSFGLALGAGPNSSTGSTQAEFFEGASFAIQRVSFLFGFHDGRVEKIGGGYGLGEPVPAAGYSPLITRYFSVRPGFGITYRIPLR